MNAYEPIPFDLVAGWPEPDMTIGKPSRPPAPVMANDEFQHVFGPWSEWLISAAQVKGAPVDYVALSLLVTASAVIGNSRWVSPWEGWREPPILWAMLVGEPSAGKSPALDAVMDSVKEIEREFSEDYLKARKAWDGEKELSEFALAQWKAEAKKAVAEGLEPPPKPSAAEFSSAPVRERISTSDSTTEKLADLMASTWRGLLQYRDELSGWLGGMDRYTNGGDRPFWLEAYGGRSFTIDRKNNPEPIVVDRLSIAVLGGTQPDKLASLLVKSDDDGLLARFLTVYPEPVPLTRPSVSVDTDRLKKAMELLRSISPVPDENGRPRPFYIPFSEDAANALQEFRKQCRAWESDASGIFKGHIGKLPGMAVRVACVLAHLDWAAGAVAHNPTEITVSHVGRACHLVGEYLRGHAYRAYGASDVPVEIRNAKRIAEIILREKPFQITSREIQRRELSGLQSAKVIEAALSVLEEAEWVRRMTEETKGRPRRFFAVNPRIGRQK